MGIFDGNGQTQLAITKPAESTGALQQVLSGMVAKREKTKDFNKNRRLLEEDRKHREDLAA